MVFVMPRTIPFLAICLAFFFFFFFSLNNGFLVVIPPVGIMLGRLERDGFGPWHYPLQLWTLFYGHCLIFGLRSLLIISMPKRLES